jgi:hypothetical protein
VAALALAALALASDPRGPGPALLGLPALAIRRAGPGLGELAAAMLSANNSARGLLGGGYGPLWPICGAALALTWPRWRRDRPTILIVGGVAAGVAMGLAQIMIAPGSAASLDRYLLHVAPLAVIGAGMATAPGPRP